MNKKILQYINYIKGRLIFFKFIINVTSQKYQYIEVHKVNSLCDYGALKLFIVIQHCPPLTGMSP